MLEILLKYNVLKQPVLCCFVFSFFISFIALMVAGQDITSLVRYSNSRHHFQKSEKIQRIFIGAVQN